MSDFDKDEWMADNNRREGDHWESLRPGKRLDLEYCDIRLKNGTELGPCWPNGKEFMELATEKAIPASGVTHLRYYESFSGGQDDDTDQDKDKDEDEDEDEDGDNDDNGFLPEMSLGRRGRGDCDDREDE